MKAFLFASEGSTLFSSETLTNISILETSVGIDFLLISHLLTTVSLYFTGTLVISQIWYTHSVLLWLAKKCYIGATYR